MITLNPNIVKIIMEVFYLICGIISIGSGILAFVHEDQEDRVTTGLFWIILGIIFAFGPYIDKFIVGCLILFLGCITLSKKIKPGKFIAASKADKEESAEILKNRIFIPAVTIALIAVICSILIKDKGALIGLGLGSLVALFVSLIITKSSIKEGYLDGSKLLQQISASVILPQLLAALGTVFNKAGVGEIIAKGLSTIVPKDNLFIGIAIYCIGMALFTLIMGNAFAAFTVITAGIGVPFVLSRGVNPAIVGALALTAGYCGTLMSPMAANFNIVPAAILETKNKNRVIMQQFKMALVMLLIHIVLMYLLGTRA